MLTLYQAEWCPYCHRVRQVLTELELTYTCVNVPLARAERTQVRRAVRPGGRAGAQGRPQGRSSAPARSSPICRPPTPPRRRRRLTPRWAATASCSSSTRGPRRRSRCSARCSPPPTSASSRETRGYELGADRLPEGYVLRAGRRRLGDGAGGRDRPHGAGRRHFSIAVFAVDGGSAIAVTRPFAEAWLYGDPALSKLTMALTAARLRGAREAVTNARRRGGRAEGSPAPAASAGRLLPLEERGRHEGRWPGRCRRRS